MSPDTAALRALHDDFDDDGHCDECGGRRPCTVRALCDAADEVERLRAERAASEARVREALVSLATVTDDEYATVVARHVESLLTLDLQTSDGEVQPEACPTVSGASPSEPDDPHGACSRNLVAVAVERDKARAALSAASEHHQDDLRRLLDCREVVRSLTDERDAARASLAALVADLWVARQWLDVATDSLTDSGDGTYVAVSESLAQVRAMLDRHAGAGS